MSDNEARDTGRPFGAVYFGTVLAVIGVGLTIAAPATALGLALVILGGLLGCTGMVLRALYGLRTSASSAGPVRNPQATRP